MVISNVGNSSVNSLLEVKGEWHFLERIALNLERQLYQIASYYDSLTRFWGALRGSVWHQPRTRARGRALWGEEKSFGMKTDAKKGELSRSTMFSLDTSV